MTLSIALCRGLSYYKLVLPNFGGNQPIRRLFSASDLLLSSQVTVSFLPLILISLLSTMVWNWLTWGDMRPRKDHKSGCCEIPCRELTEVWTPNWRLQLTKLNPLFPLSFKWYRGLSGCINVCTNVCIPFQFPIWVLFPHGLYMILPTLFGVSLCDLRQALLWLIGHRPMTSYNLKMFSWGRLECLWSEGMC
jgi:hypothetical protein